MTATLIQAHHCCLSLEASAAQVSFTLEAIRKVSSTSSQSSAVNLITFASSTLILIVQSWHHCQWNNLWHSIPSQLCRWESWRQAWPLPPDHRPEGGEFDTRPCLQTVPLWSTCQGGPLLSVQVGAFEVSKEIIFLPSEILFWDYKVCVKFC